MHLAGRCVCVCVRVFPSRQVLKLFIEEPKLLFQCFPFNSMQFHDVIVLNNSKSMKDLSKGSQTISNF